MEHLFIVGAQRSGSTYLYSLLDEHPQIQMAKPVRPEPKYFLDNSKYINGHTFYENMYFGNYPSDTIYLGEKSTSYIENIVAAKRIHNYYPCARIVMIFRDPVMRALSNYRFSVQNGYETLDFPSALLAEKERLENSEYNTSVNPYGYRSRGVYINYVEQYLTIFNKEQIYILILEEFSGNISAVQGLYRWLGVDDTYAPSKLDKKFNITTDDGKIDPAVFRELAFGYQTSLEGLEKYLNRRIETWRRQWELL